VAVGLGLLPIIPILLLPFAIVFFVVVFPLWGVALGVLGLLLLIARGLNAIAKKAGTDALEPIATGLHIAFRWVLTFGGFAGRIAGKAGEEQT
jgi:hypothetical protein